MEEISTEELDQLLSGAPGGVVKLAFDDMLTILYHTEPFYTLVKNVADKLGGTSQLSLLRVVYSADIIYLTQQLASQKSRKDNQINFNFRTLQQDGSFKWVMVSGKKTAETYQTGNKTVPVYACVAIDATEYMNDYKKLEQTNDYHNKITELSKDMYFEYEIARDTLVFSEVFREIFGKESTITSFRNRLEKSKMIHQDELPAVIDIYNSVMRGRKQVRFELRLIGKDGKAAWYLCYASIIYDENRNPFKVVGKLSTTNHFEAREEEKAEFLPQIDVMTGVCARESAEFLISEAARLHDEEGISALFVIDIRNFKGINEVRKSIHGENILTTLGGILSRNFRKTDVVGRLGISEFVIYMRDISSDAMAYAAAEQLCKSIDSIFDYSYTKSGISASMGVAIHRGPYDYQLLLGNANSALSLAKKVPNSSFEVYGGAV